MTLEKYLTLFEAILASGVKKTDAMEIAINSLDPKDHHDQLLLSQAMNAVYHAKTETKTENQIQAERDLHDHKSTETN